MKKPIGLQLYSLRADVYPGGGDLPGVMKTVAEIGYKGVELAGLHGNDPKEIAKVASDLGLDISSSHAGNPNEETVKEIADTHAALGVKKIVGGFGPTAFETADSCKASAAAFQKAAEVLKPYGMKFCFHNHWWEFAQVGGQYVYDILMAEAPDALSELDVYWCAFGKADPVKFISKYGTRQPLLHIKDGMLVEGSHVHTAVGSGKLDMPSIIGAANPDVVEYLIVELDACETDMLQAVKDSYRYLKDSGLGLGTK